MKRLAVLMLLSACAAVAAAQAVPPADATAAPQEASSSAATAVGAGAGDDASDRTCLRDTGSLITASGNARARRNGKPETCTDANGRSYSRADIDGTGAATIGDALRRLDPAVR